MIFVFIQCLCQFFVLIVVLDLILNLDLMIPLLSWSSCHSRRDSGTGGFRPSSKSLAPSSTPEPILVTKIGSAIRDSKQIVVHCAALTSLTSFAQDFSDTIGNLIPKETLTLDQVMTHVADYMSCPPAFASLKLAAPQPRKILDDKTHEQCRVGISQTTLKVTPYKSFPSGIFTITDLWLV